MRITRHNFFALLGLLAAFTVHAQPTARSAANTPLDPIISQLQRMAAAEGGVIASAELDPPVAVVGQPIIFRLAVTASPESTAPPDRIPVPPGLEVRVGGSAHNIVFTSQGMQFRTTFVFWLTARKPGTYTIPAFTISANSRQVPVAAQTLTVLPPGAPGAVRPTRLQIEAPPGASYYIGQKIVLPVAVLDPGDNSVYGVGSLKGLGGDFIFDSVPGSQSRLTRDYDGQTVSALVDHIAVVPVREGRLPLAAQATVLRKPGPLAALLPGYQPLYESLPVIISVKHLPPGALPGFTGLIGHFGTDLSKATPQPVRAGDPLDLAVTITGDGNLGRLVPPPCPGNADWQTFPPHADQNPSLSIEMSGRNVIHYTLIPQRAGQLATPAIPFSYFNPDRGVYLDLTISPVSVQVLPPVSGPVASAPARRETTGLQTMLGGLAPRPVHFAGSLRPLPQRAAFWLWQLVPAGALLGLWGWDARRRFLAAHPEVVRQARARRELRRQLQCLRQAAARRDADAFARAAVNALRTACAPATEANPQALVGNDILRLLPPELAGPDTEKLVRPLFAAVELATLRNQPPSPEILLALLPELELLLAELGRRLC